LQRPNTSNAKINENKYVKNYMKLCNIYPPMNVYV